MLFQPDINLDKLKQDTEVNMLSHLGISLTEIGEDFIKGSMPVDERTKQPFGLLHGGASVVLAETLGSIAANCCVNKSTHYCVGLEINANHIRGVRSGIVTGIAKPLHIGSSTQVWEVQISDENNKLVCISRLTVAVIKYNN